VQRLTPAVQLLGLGSYVATCIAGGTIGGFFLDKALDTGRVFTLAGLALGLAAAFYGGYRMLMDTIADINRWQRDRMQAPPDDAKNAEK
jgi:putative F0F1-ATPase subunit (Ca2+/Mg2+ transporter)